jgi:hypothetical protein
MRYLLLLAIGLHIVSCDSTTESDPETLTGFWQAKEVAQHFWLDHISADSVSGFGQVGIANEIGLVEWLPITVEGKITGNNISLLFTVSDSTNVFNGEIITVRNFLGLWNVDSYIFSVAYNKRITHN